MQINIKLKLDSKKKTLSLLQKDVKSFNLQNSQIKNKSKKIDLSQKVSQFKQASYKTERQNNKKKLNNNIIKQLKNNNSNNKIKRLSKNKKQFIQKNKNLNQHFNNNNSNTNKINHKRKNSLSLHKNNYYQQNFGASIPGLSGKKILQKYGPILSHNQKLQLINQKTVFYIGICGSQGQDDLNGFYIWRKHQQISYRYQLIQKLGAGQFGQVVKAFDHKNKQLVAIKIIKNGKQFTRQALNQINILMSIKQKDVDQDKNIIRIKDFVVFRKHVCIITQLLSISLHQLIQINYYQPIQISHIRTFAIQILNSLVFLKQNSIIHCDLKPQNILLKSKSKTGIKLIDFSTSVFKQFFKNNSSQYLYIQSRYYRAPQVILGNQIDHSIDMWGFGCIISQLALGQPIFPGSNQQQQFSLILQTLGTPSKQYLLRCKKNGKFFKQQGTPKIIKSKQGKAIIPGSRPLSIIFKDKKFIQFLNKIFVFQTQQRIKPLQALIDPWIIDQLPQPIKKQHINYVKMKIFKNQQTVIQSKNNKNKQKSTVKKHRKRNSQLVVNQKTKQKHNRRLSNIEIH